MRALTIALALLATPALADVAGIAHHEGSIASSTSDACQANFNRDRDIAIVFSERALSR